MKKQNKIASLAALIAEGGYVEHNPAALDAIFQDAIVEPGSKITLICNEKFYVAHLNDFKAATSEARRCVGNYVAAIERMQQAERRAALAIKPAAHHKPRVRIYFETALSGQKMQYYLCGNYDFGSHCPDTLFGHLKSALH